MNVGETMRERVAAEIIAMGMVTPVGLSAAGCAAAVRAGIQRITLTPVLNSHFQPVRAGFLCENRLPPLSSALSGWSARAPSRQQRLLRLATGAIQEALSGRGEPVPLLLALPTVQAESEGPPGASFLERLALQSGVSLDLRASRVLEHGRAGGLMAVEHALRMLASKRAHQVLIGGVDSFLDLSLLATLDSEGRLPSEGGPSDGLIPGEGAVFLLLASPEGGQRRIASPRVRITTVGLGREEGHRYSDKPYRGEGLSAAFQALFAARAGEQPVQCVYAGFNGENFWAKEWGVAHLRHSRRFADSLRIEHPAECTGDLGAALGPMMLGLAAIGMQQGYRRGPCLIWCSSDLDERAAVLIEEGPAR